MDDKTKADYERAAVELEEGRIPKSGVELRAFEIVADDRRRAGIVGEQVTLVETIQICRAVARILRECLEKGERLP